MSKFSGFTPPTQNWFKMPNEWIDMCADIGSLSEIKIVQYVMRHTWGHREYGIRKRISLEEFMNGRQRTDGERMDKGTGLSKPSVISGIKSAVQRGLLIEEVDDSDKARVKKYYSLRMNPEEEVPPPEEEESESDPENPPENGGVKDLYAGVKILYPDVKKVYPRGKESLPRTEKDTLERHLEKESNNNNTPESPEVSQTAVVVALSSQGIGQRVAQELAAEHPAEHIQEKLAYLEFLLADRPDTIKRPAAWLRKAIEDNYAAPDGFISAAEREQLALEAEKQAAAAEEQDRAYEERRRQQEADAVQERQAFLADLHERYSTTPADLETWQKFLEYTELSLSAANFALFQSALILRIEGDQALVGVNSTFQLQRLMHPNLTTVFKRTMKQILGHEVTPEYEVIDGLESSTPPKP